MHPVCISLGGFTVHWYGVFMAAGFVAGLLNWVWLGRHAGRSYAYCSDLLFWIMLSGIVGARLLYVFSEWDHFAKHPLAMVRIDQGGLVFHGGVLAAAVALVFFARFRRESLLDLFDFVVVPLPLAHALGRIGCFLNGCCHGRLSDLPWATAFPPESPAWSQHVAQGHITRLAAGSAPLHPVQLYESWVNLCIYCLLLAVYLRKRAPGTVVVLYLFSYAVSRFLLEFFRGDERPFLAGLSSGQWFSLAFLLLGLGFAWTARRVRQQASTERPR